MLRFAQKELAMRIKSYFGENNVARESSKDCRWACSEKYKKLVKEQPPQLE
jgi:hypothetical protein